MNTRRALGALAVLVHVTGCTVEDPIVVGTHHFSDSGETEYWVCVPSARAHPCDGVYPFTATTCEAGRIDHPVSRCYERGAFACWIANMCWGQSPGVLVRYVHADARNVECVAGACDAQARATLDSVRCPDGRTSGYTGRCVAADDPLGSTPSVCVWEAVFCNSYSHPYGR